MEYVIVSNMSLKKLTKVNTGLKCCHLMLPCNINCKGKFQQSAHYCSMIKKEFFYPKSHSNNINVKLSLSSSTLHLSHTCHFSSISPRIAIVGSGPAGFYTAQHIIKHIPGSKIDMFEKLPVPFGLMRFGVAPDHQDVKNVTKTFTQIAEHPMVNFYGNVQLGRDVHMRQLLQSYNGVVLAYGATEDKLFNIPGENLKNVLSASSFINWYNGYPGCQELDVNLDTETCVVLGQGNVAADVARMLLSPVESLQGTDMSSHAIECLRRSKVRRVCLVGRRGPLQAAFTIAELRELTKLPSCHTIFNPSDFTDIKNRISEIQRPKKRLIELMLKQTEAPPPPLKASKQLQVIFKRSPLCFLPHPSDPSSVGTVQLAVNQLQGPFGADQKALSTDEKETLDTSLVIKSIGYRGVREDAEIPFDVASGTVPNQRGRVLGVKGLYCSGWLKTGPVGVLASTMNSAYETGMSVVQDLKDGLLDEHHPTHLAATLNSIKNTCVTFSDWKKIDKHEKEMGEKRGKIREKVVDLHEMLTIANKTS